MQRRRFGKTDLAVSAIGVRCARPGPSPPAPPQPPPPPADVVRRGDWAAALDALKRAGKIRYYGISCDTAEAALAALDFPGVSSIQIQMSLLEHSTADAVMPRARE